MEQKMVLNLPLTGKGLNVKFFFLTNQQRLQIYFFKIIIIKRNPVLCTGQCENCLEDRSSNTKSSSCKELFLVKNTNSLGRRESYLRIQLKDSFGKLTREVFLHCNYIESYVTVVNVWQTAFQVSSRIWQPHPNVLLVLILRNRSTILKGPWSFQPRFKTVTMARQMVAGTES